ncbi:MAG: FxSxx-COOH system tetratricopeptide repeat protein [Gammaproteobacteria bacterium]
MKYCNSLWNVPDLALWFTGREQTLESIEEQLCLNNFSVLIPHVIAGLGGIGKTQTAIAYAHKNRELLYRDSVYWINAETSNYLHSSFIELAQRLGIYSNNSAIKELIKNIYQQLSKHPLTLLIFDNAETYEAIKFFLPSAEYSKNIHVLITSRRQDWGIFSAVSLDIFTTNEATKLVARMVSATQEEINQLSQILGYLPLAIVQAIAYIKRTKISIAEYLQQFNLYQHELLAEQTFPQDTYEQTVATTWNITLQQIKAVPGMVEILYICAFFNPDNICKDLFDQLFISFKKRNEAIAYVADYSLINVDCEAQSICIHRLVQVVIIRYLKNNQIFMEWLERSVDIINKKIVYESAYTQADKNQTRYLDNAICLLNIVEQNTQVTMSKKLSIKLIVLLIKIGSHYLHHKRDPWNAEKYMTSAKDLYENMQLTKQDIEVMLTYNFAGIAYRKGIYADAKINYEKVQILMAKIYGRQGVEYATILHKLSNTYVHLGNHALAKHYLQKSLTIKQALYQGKPNSIGLLNSILATMYQLSEIYNELEEITAAEELILQTMKLSKKYEKEINLPILGDIYYTQGSILISLNQYDAAWDYLFKAQKLWQALYGEVHCDMLICLNEMGKLLLKQKKYRAAADKFNDVINIYAKYFSGANYPAVADTKHNLGCIYLLEKKYQHALEALFDALAYKQKIYNTDAHISVVETKLKIMEVYSYLKKAALLNNMKRDIEVLLEKISEHNPPKVSKFFKKFTELTRLKPSKSASKNKIIIHTQGRLISISKREQECLEQLMEGCGTKAIASKLNISARTVETHLDNLRDKFKAKTRVELVNIINKLKVSHEQ